MGHTCSFWILLPVSQGGRGSWEGGDEWQASLPRSSGFRAKHILFAALGLLTLFCDLSQRTVHHRSPVRGLEVLPSSSLVAASARFGRSAGSVPRAAPVFQSNPAARPAAASHRPAMLCGRSSHGCAGGYLCGQPPGYSLRANRIRAQVSTRLRQDQWWANLAQSEPKQPVQLLQSRLAPLLPAW